MSTLPRIPCSYTYLIKQYTIPSSTMVNLEPACLTRILIPASLKRSTRRLKADRDKSMSNPCTCLTRLLVRSTTRLTRRVLWIIPTLSSCQTTVAASMEEVKTALFVAPREPSLKAVSRWTLSSTLPGFKIQAPFTAVSCTLVIGSLLCWHWLVSLMSLMTIMLLTVSTRCLVGRTLPVHQGPPCCTTCTSTLPTTTSTSGTMDHSLLETIGLSLCIHTTTPITEPGTPQQMRLKVMMTSRATIDALNNSSQALSHIGSSISMQILTKLPIFTIARTKPTLTPRRSSTSFYQALNQGRKPRFLFTGPRVPTNTGKQMAAFSHGQTLIILSTELNMTTPYIALQKRHQGAIKVRNKMEARGS